jgi:hypothetical protein
VCSKIGDDGRMLRAIKKKINRNVISPRPGVGVGAKLRRITWRKFWAIFRRALRPHLANRIESWRGQVVAAFVGAHRNTPKRNLDCSNLCSKTSISRIWAKYSACFDARTKNLRAHFFNSVSWKWAQIFCSISTGQMVAPSPSRPGMPLDSGGIPRGVDFS